MKIIRNIGTMLVISLLILATGGFSIYRHVCHREGEITASLFLETTCEHDHASAPASCCIVKETHSCCDKGAVPDKKLNYHKDKCCQTSIQFLKINDSFQTGLGKISLKSFDVASGLVFFYIPLIDKSIPPVNLFNADLPPPLSGKQIILAFHQLKIAPELV